MANPKTAPICWMARVVPKPGKADVLRGVLKRMVAPSRPEPGCVAYNLHEHADGGTVVFSFYEIWRSRADHSAHSATPHVRAFLARLDELVEGEVAIEPLQLLVP